jgi:hypothetical protein
MTNDKATIPASQAVTWTDIEAMYRTLAGAPVVARPDWPPYAASVLPSGESRYADFMLTGHYPLPDSVRDACPPTAPLLGGQP